MRTHLLILTLCIALPFTYSSQVTTVSRKAHHSGPSMHSSESKHDLKHVHLVPVGNKAHVQVINESNLSKPERKVLRSPIFHKRPLHYYHEYMEDRKKVNPKVPLGEHYKNERRLRKQHYKLVRKIRRLKEKMLFKAKDIQHAALGDKNQRVKLEAEGNALERRISQRHTALKFQIDHAMSWSTFYSDRLKINSAKIEVALPDEKPGLEKIIAFDKARSGYYKTEANGLWKKLETLRRLDIRAIQDLTGQINRLTGQVLNLKMKLSQVTSHYLQKIRFLVRKDQAVMGTLKSMEKLDKTRIENQKLEEERAAKGALGQKQAVNNA